jgi:glycosyltransferase involved in cell wall biosynthesis
MKIALVHEWFDTYAGSERVVEQILKLYPEAELFAIVDFLDRHNRFMGDRRVHTSFIQTLPFAKKQFRRYLPLMPLAVEQFDLSAYDLVISSHHAVAKGVITSPNQVHISYVHSPIRYAWDMQHQYLKEAGLDKGARGLFTRAMVHYMRLWDVRTSNGVDEFVANSRYIARRIKKVYGRESRVIHPPVNIDNFTLHHAKEDFYLTASRMVPYKRIDLIVEAFQGLPDKKLFVIGEGPEWSKVQKKAGPNVTLLGYQPFNVLRDYLQRAKAFVFAAEEDFGILPVEAQACGTPVIAFGRGGALDSVRALGSAQPTGVFFSEQSPRSIREAVQAFEANVLKFDPEVVRHHAESFGEDCFRRKFSQFVEQSLQNAPSFTMPNLPNAYRPQG